MAVEIRSRRSWGARHADGDINLSGLAAEVFAHHSVTKQLPASATVEQEQAAMRELEAIGQSRFGTGISYNVGVFPSGRAYQGVSFNRRGTHTGGRNSTARSIVFIGNYETNDPTPAQLATAAAIYAEGKGKWWKSTAPLRGHRDVKSTACPGRNVYAQLPAIRAGKTPTTQEEPMADGLNTEQALQLSTVHAVLTRKLTDGSGATTPDQIWQRNLDVSRRTLAALSATNVALSAAVETLSKSAGVDPQEVLDTVERTVREALPESITIPLED